MIRTGERKKKHTRKKNPRIGLFDVFLMSKKKKKNNVTTTREKNPAQNAR